MNVFAVGFPAKIDVGLVIIVGRAAVRGRLDRRPIHLQTSRTPSRA